MKNKKREFRVVYERARADTIGRLVRVCISFMGRWYNVCVCVRASRYLSKRKGNFMRLNCLLEQSVCVCVVVSPFIFCKKNVFVRAANAFKKMGDFQKTEHTHCV